MYAVAAMANNAQPGVLASTDRPDDTLSHGLDGPSSQTVLVV
jgi:hypothetical protein